MNNQLSFNATMAWVSFGNQDYSSLEQYGKEVYNYFVYNPNDILQLDNPLLIGKVFQVCLGFQEPDEDIQEVRAENAFLCFSQALNSIQENVHDEALARLMILLIRDQRHLINKVEQACQNEHMNPYNIFSMSHSDLPADMPISTNTKMLFAAYFLYNSIRNKSQVSEAFINPIEKNAYENVKNHVLTNCNLLSNTTSSRKVKLGSIVMKKLQARLRKEIAQYASK